MEIQNNRRFAFGDCDSPQSSIWRLWSHRNDIYVGVRSIAGDIKTSLHRTGMCQTSFTSEFMESDHPVRDQVQNSRHVATWSQQPIQDGLFRLLDIVIPHKQMKKVELSPSLRKKVEWFAPCKPFANTQITFLLSEVDLGPDKWIGKYSMHTKLLHKGQIPNGKTLYVVYSGNNEPLERANIQVVEPDDNQENGEYRLIRIAVDPITKVGYLIDSSADKITKETLETLQTKGSLPSQSR